MLFPHTRLRRMRKKSWVRDMFSETFLGPEHLIVPLFVCAHSPLEHQSLSELKICSLVHLERYVREKILPSGVTAVMLFPVIPQAKKDAYAQGALSADNVLLEAIRLIKDRAPDLGILVDVALDPFTSHGHDGLLDKNGTVDNDATLEVLGQLSLLYAQAGSDFVAPSDMMDGRTGFIRKVLDSRGFSGTGIMTYSSKYASCFYGPFRDVVGAKLPQGHSKKTYQMDVRNGLEALREARQDVAEGADALIVKPGILSLDILFRLKEKVEIPLVAFQVSGEYFMINQSSKNGFVSYENALMETLYVMRRAGASAIVTYGALDAARFLKSKR